ncbi:hypothetical protein R69746_07943 [Paraburkholderia aspalathi]|nr:hypothetical protein R69746_07943 [Paraburkholderia aspalathi]
MEETRLSINPSPESCMHRPNNTELQNWHSGALACDLVEGFACPEAVKSVAGISDCR